MFEWNLDTAPSNPETNRGVAYDGFNTNTLDGSGSVFKIMLTGDQDFSDAFWNASHTWTDIFKSADGSTVLQDWASIFSGGFDYSYNGQSAAPTSQGGFTITGNSLTWSAVPEPSSALVGLILVAAICRRQRGGRFSLWIPAYPQALQTARRGRRLSFDSMNRSTVTRPCRPRQAPRGWRRSAVPSGKVSLGSR
jgi:hypothetical protein